jgi:predicted GIY-YIG superfamily endonuclease
MYFVYCLVSEKNSKFHYYGFTKDFDKRISYHIQGKVRTTNRFLPIKLLGFREFEDREEALKFEKDLKTKSSYRKRFIRELEETAR